MRQKSVFIYCSLVILLFHVGCDQEIQATPTPEPVAAEATAAPVPAGERATEEIESELPARPGVVVIGELLPGVPGSNNQEFVELYNPGNQAVDLDGWSLWYLTNAGQEESLVILWEGVTEIPPRGHYLLVHEGKEVGVMADATFRRGLFEGKGGLVLRDEDGQAVDRLGWGEAPAGYFNGSPAPAPAKGNSLERLPGGEMGNGTNSSDNAADLFVNPSPNPQNSGSPPTPLPERRLAIAIDVPGTVYPGAEFEMVITVRNLTGEAIEDAQVSLPVSEGYSVLSAPEGATEASGRVSWTIPEIVQDGRSSFLVKLKSPFTYVDTLIRGYYAASPVTLAAYGPPLKMSVGGGSIPIAMARELVGKAVTVEGVATMYTGGFFAGSNTKFYIEDESGGVQVFVPGLAGSVNVDIGDRLRVSGQIEVFRDSIEVVPDDVETDIEFLDNNGPEPEATAVGVLDHETASGIIGRLNQVEGAITQIEEFTYSYELTLSDERGNNTLVLIEKDTSVTAEIVEVDKEYRVTGISEFVSGQRQLKPRLQSDIQEVFPPELTLEMKAATSVRPGQPLTYTITAFNHTAGPLDNVTISVSPVHEGAEATLAAVFDGGTLEGNRIGWTLDQLPGGGASAGVRYSVLVGDEASAPLASGPAIATADQWPEPATSTTFVTFIGDVPIWAIQGSGESSPYVRSVVQTRGIVTGVFPGLLGFWIQEPESDEDPATSAALFVLTGREEMAVSVGDLAQVKGLVRELHGQTTLQLESLEGLTVLSSGAGSPVPAIYNPPQEDDAAAVYNESLEGMLVATDSPAVVVAPTTNFGEYALVYERWGVDTVSRGDEAGYLIFVDDGATVSHQDQSTLAYSVKRGDVVEELVGILAYTFGQYKIEPMDTPKITAVERTLPALAEAGPNEFSVATFNVENLYDVLEPHPSSPPRPNGDEYRQKLNKVAETIVSMGAPAVLGLQEVENVGILEDLVQLDQLVDYGYAPYLIEGTDSRGIDNAYLVREGLVSVSGVASYPGPNELTSRPPLVMTATIQLEAGPLTLYLLNNHFLSLSAGVEATEPVRTAQAAWNVTLVERIRAADPDGAVIVMGDLNSFYGTAPIETLQSAGLRHVYEFFGSDELLPYTYIFEGATQTLDHMLVSETLFGELAAVEVLHLNADYPIPDPGDDSARRVSDHDPLIAIFSAGRN